MGGEGRVKLSYEDQEALRYAKALLENPGLAAKITGLIGMPIEKALQLLPGNGHKSSTRRQGSR